MIAGYITRDIVGVGLGPSNLALAIALVEKKGISISEKCLFLEQSFNVSWHPGMMLEGTRLQVPFLKDLVTLRNPTSHFSFLNYLKNQNRLNEFINTGETTPTRLEYSMYLNWVKDQLPKGLTQFGKRVTNVIPKQDNSSNVRELIVEYEDLETNNIYQVETKNLVVAVGGKPNIPEIFKIHIGNRVFHSSEFKDRISKWPNDESLQIGVIGSGQSAAEIIDYIHDNFP